MERTVTRIMAAGVLALAMGLTASAQQAPAASGNKGTNMSTDKGKDNSSAQVALAGQAMQLVSYARENESPVAMLAAVQMLRGVRVQDGKARVGAKKAEGTPPADAKNPTRPEPSIDPKVLLNEAKGWAKGNAQLVALIDAELAKPAASGTLGRVEGPTRHVDAVNGRTNDWYTLNFRGGEVARLQVIGDGDTDLDCFIYDENGNLITKDDDRTDFCVLQWNPRWTGPFRVKIANLGSVYNRYTLLTN